jgi:hypothetical protein
VLQLGCAALIEPPHERTVITIVSDGNDLRVGVAHHAVIASPPVLLPVMTAANASWMYRAGNWLADSPNH